MATSKEKTRAENLLPGEKLVKIKIPKTSKEKEDVWVSINERSWTIKRGVEVEVPECVALALEDQQRLLDELYERDEAAQNASSNH